MRMSVGEWRSGRGWFGDGIKGGNGDEEVGGWTRARCVLGSGEVV